MTRRATRPQRERVPWPALLEPLEELPLAFRSQPDDHAPAVQPRGGFDQLVPGLREALRSSQRLPEMEEMDVVRHRSSVWYQALQEKPLQLAELGVAQATQASPGEQHHDGDRRPQHLRGAGPVSSER